MALSRKQRRFVDEYLMDLNATQAAIRAGYPVKAARQVGSENLSKPAIADAIARAMAERSRRTGLAADRVLHELGRMALGDPRTLFRDGKLVPVDQLTADDAALVAGVKVKLAPGVDENGERIIEEFVEVKLVDKLAAIQLCMRHLGMLKDKVEVEVNEGLAARMARIRAARQGQGAPNA